jgi:hypothetical protein
MEYTAKEIDALLEKANKQMAFGRVSSSIAKQLIAVIEQQLKLLNVDCITASTLFDTDKDSFEHDLAAAILRVMLDHKIETGYKGDYGRWIECEIKHKYLYNIGGIFVRDLEFAAIESNYKE